MITNTAENLFSSSLNLITLNDTILEEAKIRFADYQDAGVIKNTCSFDDSVWQTTDEYSNIGMHFIFNKFSYRQYEPVFHLSYHEFINYVKAYMLSVFGRNALSTIRSLLLDFRRIVETDIEKIYGASEDIQISTPMLCADFFAILPDADESIEKLINAMDSYADINYGTSQKHQRSLADFDTYFLFDEVIKDYWGKDLSVDERLFYYPLYLWWVITAVLPLRPREFLLTQRDCLSRDKDGTYYLRLRRNQLKGSQRSISYKLTDDYIIDTYKIPARLGEEIQKYIDFTKDYDNTDINTLFVTDPHYKKWGQSKHSDSRYFTYINMNTLLRYFYKEIIHEKYGLNVIYDYTNCHLKEGEIRYIHLGDTRHIALINIMQEGGTPVTAMLLAGHTNAITASHYYSNLSSLIECKTYRQYRKLLSGKVEYQVSTCSTLPEVREGHDLSDGGKCYSKAYLQGDISDCLESIGDNGEIGYCPSCIYYRRKGISYFAEDDIYKRNLKDDCLALAQAIQLVRQGKGSNEDIGEALLKIHSSSISYESYLLEKEKANNIHGDNK